MALGRKTGGRKKGTPNKRTIAQREIIASGMSPLEFLCAVYRDAKQPMIRRIEAARSAAPYLHPRLTVTPFEPLQHAPNFPKIEVVFVDPPQPPSISDDHRLREGLGISVQDAYAGRGVFQNQFAK